LLSYNITIKFINKFLIEDERNFVPKKIKMDTKKMKAKKFLVSLLAIMTALLVVTVSVSAATSEIANISSVEINGIDEIGNEDVSVIAGEKISVEVIFVALEDASDVRIRAELEGSKVDSEEELFVGDLEEGKVYKKVLHLEVPYELKDEVSDDLALKVKIWNGDFRTELEEAILRVQRPSYNVELMSFGVTQKIRAGESFPVEVVLKNTGYNDLDDLYVVVSVPELNLDARAYFGDLVAIEDDDDDDNEGDTVRGRIFLTMPYDAASGLYNMEVKVSNNDLTLKGVEKIAVENDLPSNVIQSGNALILVNPTNQLKVYTLVVSGSATTLSENIVVVPAGSSRTVTVDPETSGSFSVDVFSGNKLVGKVAFTGSEYDGKTSNAVVVLTIILAIIFIVLLVALIVLVTKKPEKEEFGESYY